MNIRRILFSLPCLYALLTSAVAATPRADPVPQVSLPVTHIVLYTSGVGYFQRDGYAEGTGQGVLRFKTEHINDLLKSLVVQDFDGGQITAVTYDSRDPITRTLKSFAVDLTDNPSLGQLLDQIRGESVEVATPQPVSGVIVSVESKQQALGDDKVVEVQYLNLLTEHGLRSIALAQVQHVRLLNSQLDAELRQALAVLAASHDTQKKTVLFSFDGSGRRRVRLGYIMETPVWKTSYRLVLTENDKPFLQGWALIENTTDEDWQAVHLSLISGRPISFVMDMYEPLYAQRPVVVPELYAALKPQVYGQAMEKAGETLKEAQVPITTRGVGGKSDRDSRAEADEAKSAPAAAPARKALAVGPAASAAPATPPPPLEERFARTLEDGVITAAQGAEVGELFEYVITTPVSLGRQKSALLPIVNMPIDGTKLSIYNARVHAKHPLHGFRLRNVTPLYLLQGPLTVFDGGAYAGDARLADLPPGQERLLSYAMDVKTEVEPVSEAEQRELTSVSIRKGALTTTHKAIAEKVYTIKNRDQKTKTVFIEHPFRADWQLAAPSTPTERTREVYRFAVPVEADQGTRLRVREEKQLSQTVALTDAGPDMIMLYVRAPQVSAKVKEALQRVVALRERVDHTAQQRRQFEQRIQEITQEQSRIRDNMGRLAQNSELYNRYVRKLDQQETDVEKIRQEMETLKATGDTQQRELQSFLLQLDIE